MTEHFVVIPETNYMTDPCVRVQRNISQVGEQSVGVTSATHNSSANVGEGDKGRTC